MPDSGLPLMPVPTGGPSAPIEGAAPNGGGIADAFKSSYYQSPVVTPMVRAFGHEQNPTPVSQTDAQARLKEQGLDGAWVPKDGTTVGALQAEAERQSEVKLHEMRLNRSDAGFLSRAGGSVAAGLADPSNLVLGPAAGVLGGAVRGGIAVRAALGAAAGAAYAGASSTGYAYETGHQNDLNAWSLSRDMAIGGAMGGLLHSAFGPRPLAKAGENLTTDMAATLENSTGFAKAHGNMSPNDVISATGAVGLHQVEPATARLFGLKGTDAEITEQLRNPDINKQISQKVIDQNAASFPGDPEAQAIAYNDGPGRARQWIKNGRDDSVLPKETQGYLSRLRGAPIAERKGLAQVATQQFAADNDVNVEPFTTNPAKIADEHELEMAQIHGDAMKAAWPDPLRVDLQSDDKASLAHVDATAQLPQTEGAEEHTQAINDMKQQAAILDPDGDTTKIDNAVATANNVYEDGTQLTHDNLTKAVNAAVQCGVAKGIDYGA